jgi:hypothetical protein
MRSIFQRLDYLSGPSIAVLKNLRKTFFIDDAKLLYLPNFFLILMLWKSGVTKI